MIAIVGIAATIVVGSASAAYQGGLRLNLTASYPLGLWRIVPLDRTVGIGDLVFICPPLTPSFVTARERGYLRSGLCPGWLSPLIKTVVAMPGQRIEVVGAVTIDDAPLGHSDVRRTDEEGRKLVFHKGGVVPPNHLFLHSDFAGSYDSRYFGPIPDAGLLGLAQPVLTFAP